MEAEREAVAKPTQDIIAKTQVVLVKTRELIGCVRRLEQKLGVKQAQVNDLSVRIERLERTRKEARERLNRIVAELPER